MVSFVTVACERHAISPFCMPCFSPLCVCMLHLTILPTCHLELSKFNPRRKRQEASASQRCAVAAFKRPRGPEAREARDDPVDLKRKLAQSAARCTTCPFLSQILTKSRKMRLPDCQTHGSNISFQLATTYLPSSPSFAGCDGHLAATRAARQLHNCRSSFQVALPFWAGLCSWDW